MLLYTYIVCLVSNVVNKTACSFQSCYYAFIILLISILLSRGINPLKTVEGLLLLVLKSNFIAPKLFTYGT